MTWSDDLWRFACGDVFSWFLKFPGTLLLWKRSAQRLTLIFSKPPHFLKWPLPSTQCNLTSVSSLGRCDHDLETPSVGILDEIGSLPCFQFLNFWIRIGAVLGLAGLNLDHDDPSKPSHRLTNGPEPSKTIESDGRKIKNHRKTIDGNGQTAKKHSMVMVSSKTIGNLQWSLQNHWNLQLLQE